MADRLELHIISNTEVSLTECGRLMASPVPDLTSTGPQPVAGGGYALWDDSPIPPSAWMCHACYTQYMA